VARLVPDSQPLVIRVEGDRIHARSLLPRGYLLTAVDVPDRNRRFVDIVDSQKLSVPVTGVLETDEMDVVRAAVVAGLGISFLPLYLAADELRQGQLVPLLRQYQILPESAVYLVYLPNLTLSSRVRALIDFLVARFGPVPSWDVGW